MAQNGNHSPAGGYRSYTLHQVDAAAVEPTLRRLLPPGTDLQVDSRSNRILIQGSPQAHDVAQRTLHAMDQPPARSEVRAVAYVQSEPYLQTYASPPGQASAFAESLRRQLANTPGIHVAGDDRTSQVLVMAPASVHAVVAAQLQHETPGMATVGPTNGPTAGPLANPSPISSPTLAPAPAYDSRVTDDYPGAHGTGRAAAPSSTSRPQGFIQSTHESTSQTYGLRSISPQVFTMRLRETLGERCIPVLNASQEENRELYRLPLADGSTLTVQIDRLNGQVQVVGSPRMVSSAIRMVALLDNPMDPAAQGVRLLAYDPARAAGIHRVAQVVGQPADDPAFAAAQTNGASNGAAEAGLAAEAGRNIVGPVQIEVLDGLDMLVIRGDQTDVSQVVRLIEQIERLSLEYEPQITVYPLRHAGSVRIGDLVRQLYDEIFSVRQGAVSITALVKPNALLLIGRNDSVGTAIDLIQRLDKPVAPESQFQVFRLRHAAAEAVRQQIDEFYANRQGLGTEVRVTSDYRTNALIVQAAPRDLVEVASMIMRVDTPDSDSVKELRVFTLRNALASELAPVLQQAILGQATGVGATADQRSAALAFATVDAGQNRLLRSGVVSDVRITADTRGNALLVSAPSDSMPLIEALIRQMDQLPIAKAQIKVFTIINSDATNLTSMLQSLFGTTTQANQPAVRTGAGADESTLVTLQFAVDVRTNSIIASGSEGDLNVVEAILLRLDESDIQNRHVTVYRLLNAPAADVATAINQYLQNERQVERATAGIISPFETIEREVVVVPEAVSNSLIVSTTPRYYRQIKGIIEQLDERPPMVMIQVLIAEVDLDDAKEVGFEAGIQDSILFNRSALSNVQTISRTVTNPGEPQVVTQEIISSNANPGFLFNDVINPLGNNAGSGRTNNLVGTQGLSNFGMGRASSELGFGGFVFSASSESISLLIRALQQQQRLEVLSRPQIMTLDNQPAFIQIGERVPRITGTQTNEAGMTNSITMEEVGLILGVTPRISPDGLVVMEIDAEKSAVGPESEGIPVSVQAGMTIRSPRIETTTAQTTISAMDGQTVILGGLITKYKSQLQRKVPLLGDIPILGQLFRFDSVRTSRKELIIILTPRVVRTEEDMNQLKQEEAQRMHWCICNVVELNNDPTLRKRTDDWSDMNIETVYPTEAPRPDMVPPADPSLPMEAPLPPRTRSPQQPLYVPEREIDRLPSPTPVPYDGQSRRMDAAPPSGWDSPRLGAPYGYDAPPAMPAPRARSVEITPAAGFEAVPYESYSQSAVTRAEYREPATWPTSAPTQAYAAPPAGAHPASFQQMPHPEAYDPRRASEARHTPEAAVWSRETGTPQQGWPVGDPRAYDARPMQGAPHGYHAPQNVPQQSSPRW